MNEREKLIMKAVMRLWNAIQSNRMIQRITRSDVKFIESFSVDELGRLSITRTFSKKCDKDIRECGCNGFHYFKTQTDAFITLTAKEQNRLFDLSYRVKT